MISGIKDTSNTISPFTFPYGECTTEASTLAKTVTISNCGIDNLVAGLVITVKFTNGIVPDNTTTGAAEAYQPTLKVNNFEAKIIDIEGYTNVYIPANGIVNLIYDGTYWRIPSGCSINYANGSTSTEYKVITGTKSVSPGGGDSAVVLTAAEQTNLFNRTFNTSTDFFGVMNSNGSTCSAHYEGATYVNGSLYVVLDRSTSSTAWVNWLWVGPA